MQDMFDNMWKREDEVTIENAVDMTLPVGIQRLLLLCSKT
jgi:hypothetical protein